MIIILSPSKTMDFASKPIKPGQPSAFAAQAAEIVDAVNHLDRNEFQKLAKTSDKVTDQTLKKFAGFDDCTPRPGLWIYTGMVYSGLNAESFSDSDVKFATRHLRVLSAVYGYVKPLDLIKEYRLEMQTKITVGDSANLYDFWGDKIAKALLVDNPDFVLNLASEEYFKCLKPYLPANLPVIAPKFVEMKEGSLKEATVYTKYMRGVFVNWVITNQISTIDRLTEFDHLYTFDPKSSQSNQPVFIRSPGWVMKAGHIIRD